VTLRLTLAFLRKSISPTFVVPTLAAIKIIISLVKHPVPLTSPTAFGGTALSSYGGFWIGTAIILTPGGFQIQSSYSTIGDCKSFAD